MTTSRLAAYIGGASLLLAWMASASGIVRQPARARVPTRATDAAVFESIATDVQAQAARLKKRLAAAPAPDATARNPFAFDARPVRTVHPVTPRTAAPAVIEDEGQPAVFEPPLFLVGIAEEKNATALVRTAIITTGGDELFMLTEGQTFLSRYHVVAVGADAVELKDGLTGATRRLALQQ